MRKEMYPRECKVCGYVRIDDDDQQCKNEKTGKSFGHDDFLRIVATDARSYGVRIVGELPTVEYSFIRFRDIDLFMCPSCGIVVGKAW